MHSAQSGIRFLVLFACAFLATGSWAADFTLSPLKAGGIYKLGERAGWIVEPAGAPVGGYTYALRKNNLEVLKSGTLDLSTTSTIDVQLNEPATLFLEIKGASAEVKPIVAGAAIAP